MAKIDVCCPACKQTTVVKFGQSKTEKHYHCENNACDKKTFILDYTNKGYLPHIKKQIVDMALKMPVAGVISCTFLR